MEMTTPAKHPTGMLPRSLGAAQDTSGWSEHEGDAPEERDCVAVQIVKALMYPATDANPFLGGLTAHVYQIACMTSSGSKPAFRRTVMAQLRALGYDAGICQTRWDDSWGLLAGWHEYIDVVAVAVGDGQRTRYIVDLDFAAEFEVARPTETYKEVVAALPRVAVAEEVVVEHVVLTVAEAARRSLRARGLLVPPWRESSFMLAKWLGRYRRTINPDPVAALGCGVNFGPVGLQSTEE